MQQHRPALGAKRWTTGKGPTPSARPPAAMASPAVDAHAGAQAPPCARAVPHEQGPEPCRPEPSPKRPTCWLCWGCSNVARRHSRAVGRPPRPSASSCSKPRHRPSLGCSATTPNTSPRWPPRRETLGLTTPPTTTQSDYTGREEANTGNSITGLHQNRARRSAAGALRGQGQVGGDRGPRPRPQGLGGPGAAL